MTIKPSRLPKIRDQIVQHLTDPNSSIRAALPSGGEELEHLARQLAVAELWWVTAPMAALAVSAAATLDPVPVGPADQPARFGFAVWDGGVGTVEWEGIEIPVDAASWGPDHEGRLTICHWISRDTIVKAAAVGGGTVEVEKVPPLAPVMWQPIPDRDMLTAETIPDGARTVVTTLAATWLLAAQPTLGERSRVEVDRSVRRAYGRAGRGDPEVTLIDLRRRYVSSDRGEDSDAPGRRFRYRWVVAGHWRDQPWGPERSLRRRQWIPSYLKGPDGAPLLETTRVNVWRR